jgi:periplasmic protein TonB
MKTNELLRTSGLFKVVLILSVFAVAVFILPTCGKNKSTEVNPDVYTKVDEMPVFAGGDAAILDYIAKNTVYPEDAKKNGIQGKVIVKMVVNKDGTVSNVEVLQSADPLLDAEAVRVVGNLPKFEKPGILNGKAVAVNFVLPISFKLQ